jgi:hypothetical protein
MKLDGMGLDDDEGVDPVTDLWGDVEETKRGGFLKETEGYSTIYRRRKLTILYTSLPSNRLAYLYQE